MTLQDIYDKYAEAMKRGDYDDAERWWDEYQYFDMCED